MSTDPISGVPPRVGQTLADRYRLVRQIGEGGMGQVFEAEHLALGRPFALKVLRLERWSDELVLRFQREARALARVRTPRVAQVTDFGVADIGPFYVMELIEGETLERRLERLHRLTPEHAVDVGVALCEALHDVHAAGIVHRDIKPSNIGLCDGGPVPLKLLDFGLAASIDDSFLQRITHSQQVIGSLPYMAPEQFQGKRPTTAIDLWAVGVVLFETLTGRLPFRSDSAAAMIHQILAAPTPALQAEVAASAETGAIPPGLEAVMARLLDKDPAGRFASAKAAAEALRQLAPAAAGLPPTRALPVSEEDRTPLPPTLAATTMNAATVSPSDAAPSMPGGPTTSRAGRLSRLEARTPMARSDPVRGRRRPGARRPRRLWRGRRDAGLDAQPQHGRPRCQSAGARGSSARGTLDAADTGPCAHHPGHRHAEASRRPGTDRGGADGASNACGPAHGTASPPITAGRPTACNHRPRERNRGPRRWNGNDARRSGRGRPSRGRTRRRRSGHVRRFVERHRHPDPGRAMMSRRIQTLTMLLAVAAAPHLLSRTRASAQDTPTTQAQHARALFAEGVTALQQHDYPGAERDFAESYRRLPRAATQCNLALTYDRWEGHVRQAVDAYRRCAHDDTSGRFRAHAAERAEALQAMLGQRDASSTTDADASPSPPNGTGLGAQGTSTSGSSTDTGLSPTGTPFETTPHSTGGTPGAGPAPLAPTPVTPLPAPGRSHTLLFIGIGAALAAAASTVAGVVFMGHANSADMRLTAAYPDGAIPAVRADGSTNPDVQTLDDARTDKATGVVLYVVGGALGALGVALVVVDLTAPTPGGASPTAVAFAPVPGGGAITARGAF